jgi:hypothetical protein
MDNRLHSQDDGSLGFYDENGTMWFQRDQSRTIGRNTERFWLFEAQERTPRVFLLEGSSDPDASVPALRAALAKAMPVDQEDGASSGKQDATTRADEVRVAGIDRLQRAMKGEFTRAPRKRKPK